MVYCRYRYQNKNYNSLHNYRFKTRQQINLQTSKKCNCCGRPHSSLDEITATRHNIQNKVNMIPAIAGGYPQSFATFEELLTESLGNHCMKSLLCFA